jgi:hypothetical protein
MSAAQIENPIDAHVAAELEHIASDGVAQLPQQLDLHDVMWAGTPCPTICRADIVDDGRLLIEWTPPSKRALVEATPDMSEVRTIPGHTRLCPFLAIRPRILVQRSRINVQPRMARTFIHTCRADQDATRRVSSRSLRFEIPHMEVVP